MSTLDIHEAAALAKCHPDTMRKLMKAGEAPGTKVGRAWVVLTEEFEKWLGDKCRSTNASPVESGGSGLAARLARRRAQRIANERRSSNRPNESDSGDDTNSETVVLFRGRRQPSDG